MRRVRDYQLPVAFLLWIDRTAPLPSGVTVLPRTISVMTEVVLVTLALMGCVGIGLPMVAMVPHSEPSIGGWAVVGLIAASLLGFLIWVAYRLVRTVSAHRDRSAGVLRLGILVGPEGILVRLAPDRCYPITMDRFVRAEAWSGGGEDGSGYLRIVSKDGQVDIWEHDITVDAADVNRAVSAVVASSSSHPVLKSAERPYGPDSQERKP